MRLERGFQRLLTVRDDQRNTPLGGARFVTAAGHTLGVSDARGRVLLFDAEWPTAPISIELAGYSALEWRAECYWTHHEGSVWLRRE